jgi:sulfofructose kinase
VSSVKGRRGAGTPRVLCAGIAVLDEVFRVEEFPIADTKGDATEFVSVGGGCAANAAVAVARLGGQARFAGPLGGPAGQEAVGDRILAGLERERVDCAACVRVSGVPSSISAIVVNARGERTIVNHRDNRLAAALPKDVDGLVASADVVLADNRFPEFVLPICMEALRRGIPVVLDADKPTHTDDALFNAASHVIFSAEGLYATAGSKNLRTGLTSMREYTQAFLAVTDGPNDVLWLDGEGIRAMPVFKIEAVDTLAAGDVFHAGFALALAEGCGVPDAMRFAAAAAAVKCMRFGGSGVVPLRSEVDAFLGERALT